MGREPSFSSCKIENHYKWPKTAENLTPKMLSELIGLAMEEDINFYNEFYLHFSGQDIFASWGWSHRGQNNNGCSKIGKNIMM